MDKIYKEKLERVEVWLENLVEGLSSQVDRLKIVADDGDNISKIAKKRYMDIEIYQHANIEIANRCTNELSEVIDGMVNQETKGTSRFNEIKQALANEQIACRQSDDMVKKVEKAFEMYKKQEPEKTMNTPISSITNLAKESTASDATHSIAGTKRMHETSCNEQTGTSKLQPYLSSLLQDLKNVSLAQSQLEYNHRATVHDEDSDEDTDLTKATKHAKRIETRVSDGYYDTMADFVQDYKMLLDLMIFSGSCTDSERQKALLTFYVLHTKLQDCSSENRSIAGVKRQRIADGSNSKS